MSSDIPSLIEDLWSNDVKVKHGALEKFQLRIKQKPTLHDITVR